MHTFIHTNSPTYRQTHLLMYSEQSFSISIRLLKIRMAFETHPYPSIYIHTHLLSDRHTYTQTDSPITSDESAPNYLLGEYAN